jgi:hypothetical protein
MNTLYLSPARVACFDNEPLASAPVPKPTPAPAPATPKTITQDELNRILADDRRKHMGKLAAVEQMLQEVSESKNLTVREREQVEQQLEELRRQTRSKEEQSAHEKKQLEDQYQRKVREAENKAKEFETRYRESTIERDLQDAAVSGDAFNPETVKAVLRPLTRLEEITDDKGKPTGKFCTIVDFPDTDPNTGEPVTLPLPAKKAVKRMMEMTDKFGNLWRHTLASGAGANSGLPTGAGGKIDPRKLSQEQYLKIRQENPALLGLRPQKGKSGR